MKINKFLLVSLLLSTFSLTACDLAGLMSKAANEGDESSQNAADNSNSNAGGNSGAQGGDNYDDSIFDKPDSLKKLMAFGKNTGFEITTKATSNDGDDGDVVIAMKGNTWWLITEDGSGTGYRLENGKCAMLSNTEGKWSVLIADVGETQYEAMFESMSSYLYEANTYFANNGFDFDGNIQYAGRNAMKFKYARTVATVSVKHEYYVDADLGISLYQYAETVSGSDKDWAKLETTSFKTGNDVTPITVA